MGINSTNVAYGFGQMGSGHLKAVATDFFAPKGKVIVAIAMLENVLFDKLLGDTSYQTGSASVDEGPSDTAYFGTGTQIAANGGDGEAGGYNQALSAAIAATVSFPAGLTIYGRWTNISLQGSDYTHGIIVYYGQ
tara:strand:+ start:48 stop:452 length:405 start_codon:yes stop_codon:yes gene_type:complete